MGRKHIGPLLWREIPPLSSKVVCFVDILAKIIQNKAINAFFLEDKQKPRDLWRMSANTWLYTSHEIVYLPGKIGWLDSNIHILSI